jgi:hypothetical protein
MLKPKEAKNLARKSKQYQNPNAKEKPEQIEF